MFVLAAQLEGAFRKEGPKVWFLALKSTGSKIMKVSYDATGSLQDHFLYEGLCWVMYLGPKP